VSSDVKRRETTQLVLKHSKTMLYAVGLHECTGNGPLKSLIISVFGATYDPIQIVFF